MGFSSVAFATAANAAVSCGSVHTVTISSTAVLLTVSPAVAVVPVGDCVEFANNAKFTVSVSVTGADSYGPYSLTAGAVTPRGIAFAPKTAGADVVNASGSSATGIGTITVVPAAVPTVTPTPTPTHSPKPSHPSKSGSPKPSSGSSSSSAATPTPSPTHSKRARPRPTGVLLPSLPPLPSSGQTAVPLGTNPVVAPGLVAATPTPTTTASEAAMVVAGPIEPLDGDGRGLPEAVAIVMVLGLVTGWGRVLLASHAAVDDDPRGNHRL
jgi:plastocyanin